MSLLMLYCEIGGVLAQRQKQAGWGAAVLPKLATDLQNELPEVKGFSLRNLNRMVQFPREYHALFSIGQRAVARLPWAHNAILLLQTCLSMKRIRPAIVAEYREKLERLQREHPLAEPANGIAQRLLASIAAP